MFYKNWIAAALCCLTLTACQEDMLPSGDDNRNAETEQVGKTIDDVSFTLSTGEIDSLNNRLQRYDAVVLYFTMWCPVCTEHMISISRSYQQNYPNVDFMFVDYLTRSVSQTRNTQLSQGWDGFDTISDANNALEDLFNGTMAITVVIDKNSIVQMNEEFKNGVRLSETLDAL